jgi:hypothetical protein
VNGLPAYNQMDITPFLEAPIHSLPAVDAFSDASQATMVWWLLTGMVAVDPVTS